MMATYRRPGPSSVAGGERFVLAASRLAFCGGFDLEDPETLAEAAAAAALPVSPVLAAAGDRDLDGQLAATAADLGEAGVRRLPAIRIGGRWLQGVGAPSRALALVEASAPLGGSGGRRSAAR